GWFGQCDLTRSQPRCQRSRRFRRRDHRNDLEFDQVLPAGGPLRQECLVLALHGLEAAPEVLRHPTRHVAKVVRHESAFVRRRRYTGSGSPCRKRSMTMYSILASPMNAKANRGHRVRYRPASRASCSRLGSGGAWQPRIAMPVDPATTPCTSPGRTKITSPAWIGV